MYNNELETKTITSKPRIKLNHNICATGRKYIQLKMF